MTTAMEAFLITKSTHDERLCTHATGNDPELALSGTHGTLSSHEHILTTVVFTSVRLKGETLGS